VNIFLTQIVKYSEILVPIICKNKKEKKKKKKSIALLKLKIKTCFSIYFEFVMVFLTLIIDFNLILVYFYNMWENSKYVIIDQRDIYIGKGHDNEKSVVKHVLFFIWERVLRINYYFWKF
jgi:hypothetical protein